MSTQTQTPSSLEPFLRSRMALAEHSREKVRNSVIKLDGWLSAAANLKQRGRMAKASLEAIEGCDSRPPSSASSNTALSGRSHSSCSTSDTSDNLLVDRLHDSIHVSAIAHASTTLELETDLSAAQVAYKDSPTSAQHATSVETLPSALVLFHQKRFPHSMPSAEASQRTSKSMDTSTTQPATEANTTAKEAVKMALKLEYIRHLNATRPNRTTAPPLSRSVTLLVPISKPSDRPDNFPIEQNMSLNDLTVSAHSASKIAAPAIPRRSPLRQPVAIVVESDNAPSSQPSQLAVQAQFDSPLDSQLQPMVISQDSAPLILPRSVGQASGTSTSARSACASTTFQLLQPNSKAAVPKISHYRSTSIDLSPRCRPDLPQHQLSPTRVQFSDITATDSPLKPNTRDRHANQVHPMYRPLFSPTLYLSEETVPDFVGPQLHDASQSTLSLEIVNGRWKKKSD